MLVSWRSGGSHLWNWQTLLLSDDAEEAPPADEADAQPVKRAAEEEEVGWCLDEHNCNCVAGCVSLAFFYVDMFFFSLLFVRKKRTQKSRRQRKTAIQKRQKWRPRPSVLLPVGSSVSTVRSTSYRRACAFCNHERDFFFVPSILAHCTGVLTHSGLHPFFKWNVIYWSLKRSFVFLVLIGPHLEIFFPSWFIALHY